MWKTSVWRLGPFAQALIRPASRVPLDWKTSVWRLGSFAQAVISARLNVEGTGLAVGLLRGSAHPPWLARGPRPGACRLAPGAQRRPGSGHGLEPGGAPSR